MERAHRHGDRGDSTKAERVCELALGAEVERDQQDGPHLWSLWPRLLFPFFRTSRVELHPFRRFGLGADRTGTVLVLALQNRIERSLDPVRGGDHSGQVRDERRRVDVGFADKDEVDERDCWWRRRRRRGACLAVRDCNSVDAVIACICGYRGHARMRGK